MSLAGFLSRVVQALEDSGIPHMLTGSLAAAYYAVPRATQDVDLVVEADPSSLEDLVGRLKWATALSVHADWRKLLEASEKDPDVRR